MTVLLSSDQSGVRCGELVNGVRALEPDAPPHSYIQRSIDEIAFAPVLRW
jgi:hypothetical protein